MESPQEHESPPTSRLLHLPREIRDLIFEYVLVKVAIPIECAITKASSTRTRGIDGWDLPKDIKEVFPLMVPWAHRRVWSVPAFDIAMGYSDNDRHSPSAVQMTYQIQREIGGKKAEGAHISLFQVCRQTYAEANEIFYGKNTFSFTSDFRIPTAFAFLCDRPPHSLRHIKSLELSLLESSNMRGTTEAPYPIIRRSTDSLVLQFTYHYFTELCTLLSTPRLSLERLYLTVETMASAGDGGVIDLRDGLAREEQKMNSPRPWVPIWIDPLLKIEGLEILEMRWVSNRPQIQRMVDTMDLMQRGMLTGTPKKHTSHVLTECIDGSESLKLRLQSDDRINVHCTSENDPVWKIVSENDGLVSPRVRPRNETQEFNLFTSRPHCRELLESYAEAYASYFGLKRAYSA